MKRGREEVSEVDMANNCLMLLDKVGESDEIRSLRERDQKGSGAFKCKTCNRRFNSFQALGGHRASHKKPKLMVSDLSCNIHHQLRGSKPRMHPCPICGLEFSIGQALGGHMRKHRVANEKKRFNLCPDLNLPPLENDLKLDIRIPVLNIVSFD